MVRLFPSNGLVAWWPFSDNIIDQSGNGHHAIVFGAKLTNDRNSVANSAFYFNNDSMRILKTGDFNLPQFSVSGWLNTAMPGEQYHTMFSHYLLQTGLYGYWTGVYQNKACLWISDGDMVGNRIRGLAEINDGNWHFIAGTYDGDTGKIYVDGVFENSLVCNMELLASQTYIGNDQQHENFTGSLDDIGFWNRELTAKEVYLLYKQVPNLVIGLKKEKLLDLYPDPASNQIKVNTSGGLIGFSYSIYNATGKLVMKGLLEAEESIIE